MAKGFKRFVRVVIAVPKRNRISVPSPLIGVADTKLKIKDIAKNMFLTGSEHVSLREQFGLSISQETLRISRGYITQIIEKWGDYYIDSLEPREILHYLFKVERSGSWKNSYIGFSEIFQESLWFGCNISKPNFRSFVWHSKKADIFSTQELEILFKKENFPNEMMYLIFVLRKTENLSEWNMPNRYFTEYCKKWDLFLSVK